MKYQWILVPILLLLGGFMLGCTGEEDAPRPTLLVEVIQPTNTPGLGATQVPTESLPIFNTPLPAPVIQGATIFPTATTVSLVIQDSPPLPANTEVAIQATVGPEGQVAQGRGGLRVRTLPSENAGIIANLEELTSLDMFGRTEDNVWVNVTASTGVSGWILSSYLEFYIDINVLPVIRVDVSNLPTQIPLPAVNNTASDTTTTETSAVALPVAGQGSIGYVVADGNGVRIRKQPSTNSQIMGVLAEQSPVTILGRSQDSSWLQIQTADTQVGWVFAQYIQNSLNVAALSVPQEAFVATPEVFVPPTTNAAQGAISGVTSNSSKIFLTGQRLGNRPDVFSKVGDSITATGHFLYPFGWGNYNLHEYAYFADVVGFFSRTTARESNSFANGSLAAKPYWKTSTILDPSMADGGSCLPGEIPLVCEYRVVRPSVALIMMGTNDIGQNSPQQYQANLQKIVEISISMGVIPVLSTLPPRVGTEGDVNVFNSIIIATARGYDVPLWDYYSAMIQLPNQGLNEDGVHPSWIGSTYDNYGPSGDFTADNLKYGFVLRNLMALQVLDAIWRQVIAPNQNAVAVSGSNTDYLNIDKILNDNQVVVQQPVVNASSSTTAGTTFTTSTTTSCPGAPPPRLSVGRLGRVTPGESNNFRSAPSSVSSKIGEIPGGAIFNVMEGPICADGLTYWKVIYNNQEGWTAEGQGNTYWLEPL